MGVYLGMGFRQIFLFPKSIVYGTFYSDKE